MRKAAAVDRRFRRAGRSPSSDSFLGRWTSLHSQKPTSRHFIVSANQRAFALTHRPKAGRFTLYGHRRTAEKRRLCFIEGKTTDFISNRRNFTKEKLQHNRKKKTLEQNKWTFFRTLPIFRPNHAPFREKPIFGGLPSSPLAFPRAQTRPNGHAPTHIAHSASLHFLPSPFTFTHNTLIIKRNKGEDKHQFNTSPVKATQALPSPLTLSAPKFYAHEVKR